MTRENLADMISRVTPEDGALDGKLHPKWMDACEYAAAQMKPLADEYKTLTPGTNGWVYRFAKDTVAVRNQWLADNG